jgi:hypothetical protein
MADEVHLSAAAPDVETFDNPERALATYDTSHW